MTREDIEESFGIRAVLEGYAARLATVRHEPGASEAPVSEELTSSKTPAN